MVDGILERFTESVGKKYSVTDKTKTKLLAWICVVWLHIDEYSTEVAKVAQELSMPPNKSVDTLRLKLKCSRSRVQDIFKSVGCKVDVASPIEREKLGISLADARLSRKAVLKTPVVFPKQRTRAPVRR